MCSLTRKTRPRSCCTRSTTTRKPSRRTADFVVNLVDEPPANAMQISSKEFPETVSEFEQTGLSTAPAVMVRHPRIAEAAASFECRLYQLLEISGTRQLVLGEMLLVHARDGVIDPQSKRISEEHYRPIGRLFADRYCTTRQRFKLPGDLPA